MHGLCAPIQMSVPDNSAEGANLFGLVLRIHGLVGMLPVTEHAQPFEICTLLRDLLGGKGATGRTKRLGIELLPGPAMFLFDGQFDRQAVTVPAGNIGRVKTIQRAGFHNDVFQNLVDRVAKMNRAVGIGRTVMQDKSRPAQRCLANLRIHAALFPALQHRRFALRQIRLHREFGVR